MSDAMRLFALLLLAGCGDPDDTDTDSDSDADTDTDTDADTDPPIPDCAPADTSLLPDLCGPFAGTGGFGAFFVPTGGAAVDVSADFQHNLAYGSSTYTTWTSPSDGDLVFCDDTVRDGGPGDWSSTMAIDHHVRVSGRSKNRGDTFRFGASIGDDHASVTIAAGASVCVPDGGTLVARDVVVGEGARLTAPDLEMYNVWLGARSELISSHSTEMRSLAAGADVSIDAAGFLYMGDVVAEPGMKLSFESGQIVTGVCLSGADVVFRSVDLWYGFCLVGDSNLVGHGVTGRLGVDASAATGPTTIDITGGDQLPWPIVGSPYGTTVTLDQYIYGGLSITNADVTLSNKPANEQDFQTQVTDGSLFCESCGFALNIVSDMPGGAALYASNSDVSFVDSTFDNLGAWHEYDGRERPPGGAIRMDGGTLSLDGCSFSTDYANWGGAIALYGVAADFTDADFGSCYAATTGGAIWLDDTSDLTLSGGSFSDNDAETSGSAIQGGASIKATKVDFSSNTLTPVSSNGSAWDPGLAATFSCSAGVCTGSGL